MNEGAVAALLPLWLTGGVTSRESAARVTERMVGACRGIASVRPLPAARLVFRFRFRFPLPSLLVHPFVLL